MTSVADAREALYQEFYDNLTVVDKDSNLVWENRRFDPPDDEIWLRFSVRHFTRNQVSLGDVGGRKYERRGSVFVQCFAPQKDGMKGTDDVVAEVVTILEGKTLTPDNVRLFSANVREIGLLDGYHQTNVEVPFFYQETR